MKVLLVVLILLLLTPWCASVINWLQSLAEAWALGFDVIPRGRWYRFKMTLRVYGQGEWHLWPFLSWGSYRYKNDSEFNMWLGLELPFSRMALGLTRLPRKEIE